MGFFSRKKGHTIPQECIYDPYLDLESEIIGEVQRIMKADNDDFLSKQSPDYEEYFKNNEDEKKHLLKLIEIADGCDDVELACFMMIARKNYPRLWHIVNAKADEEMRKKLEEYERLGRGTEK